MEKRIQEKISSNPFRDLKEANIDDQLFQLKGVCLFGTRFSENNREYSSNAVNDLLNLSEGAKMHLNHISKDEKRNYGGARDIKTWGGIFSDPERRGDAIHATLECRESIYPLLKDIARLSPKKVGFSLDAMISVSNENGKEVIEGIKQLREFSLVSAGATISNLFEAIQNGTNSDVQEFVDAIEGRQDVDYKGLQEFLEDLKGNNERGLKENKIKDGRKLSRQEVDEAVQKYFGSGGGGKQLSQKEKDLISDVFGIDI